MRSTVSKPSSTHLLGESFSVGEPLPIEERGQFVVAAVPRGLGRTQARRRRQFQQRLDPHRVDTAAQLPALLELTKSFRGTQQCPHQHGHFTVASVGALRSDAHLEPGREPGELISRGDRTVADDDVVGLDELPRGVVRGAHVDQQVVTIRPEVVRSDDFFGRRRGQHDHRAFPHHVLSLAERTGLGVAVDPHRTVNVFAELLRQPSFDGHESLLDPFDAATGEIHDVAPRSEQQDVSHPDHTRAAGHEHRTLVNRECVQIENPHPLFRLSVRHRDRQGITVADEHVLEELEGREHAEHRTEEAEHVLHVLTAPRPGGGVCAEHHHVGAVPEHTPEDHVQTPHLGPPLPTSHLGARHQDGGGVGPHLLLGK